MSMLGAVMEAISLICLAAHFLILCDPLVGLQACLIASPEDQISRRLTGCFFCSWQKTEVRESKRVSFYYE